MLDLTNALVPENPCSQVPQSEGKPATRRVEAFIAAAKDFQQSPACLNVIQEVHLKHGDSFLSLETHICEKYSKLKVHLRL